MTPLQDMHTECRHENVFSDITALQRQMNRLQQENAILREILDSNNIPYAHKLSALDERETIERYDENQGARIIHPEKITSEMASIFYDYFHGRTDVYALRSEKNGKAGYFPKCRRFWSEACPKKYGRKQECGKCEARAFEPVNKAAIYAHLEGRSPRATDVMGTYPLLKNGNCRFLVFDFDNHEKGAMKEDFANHGEAWREEVDAMREICERNGIDPLVERSRSGRGAHLWIIFDGEIPAALARQFGNALLEKGAEEVNLKSFQYYDRMFPAQDMLRDQDGIGNLIALPLQGRALRDGNSAFIDRNWNAYPDQWQVLKSNPRISKTYLEARIREWRGTEKKGKSERSKIDFAEKPWERTPPFSATGAPKGLRAVLVDGIYISKEGCAPSLLNGLRLLAAFRNSDYYKKRASGLSTLGKSSWVYLGEDVDGYIHLPQGLLDSLTHKCTEAGIPLILEDGRSCGRKIDVSFRGTLRPEQQDALDALLPHENGILHAATAFGKTVVCAAMIASRKVSTLVILESRSLISQWMASFDCFLDIRETAPEYLTATGRKKSRKSVIGLLRNPTDTTTGIIDIAMAGSIFKKGNAHPRLESYGMIIVDECHHAASDRIARVLAAARSKYIFGVTATPIRGDGMEKALFMLLGPVRFRYTAKQRVADRDVRHYVVPRFTRSVAPRGSSDRLTSNEAYEIIRKDRVRDEQILRDVAESVCRGRTPVILSRFRDHAEELYKRLQEYAGCMQEDAKGIREQPPLLQKADGACVRIDHVFLMTGKNTSKENRRIQEEMRSLPAEETMVLVATGQLLGEGFDFPRLDTLLLASPVSFRGVVEQFAGRLDRDYPDKKEVCIYDYVDIHIPFFDRMYTKRLRAYKQIGYMISGEKRPEHQDANAIFDSANYLSAYTNDLKSAARTIIISSPVISDAKVAELIKNAAPVQETGVTVTVVTWRPDSYRFGRAEHWMGLQEQMREAGIAVLFADDACLQFAVIDDEIVWYGRMNLLGKEDAEDSLMRIRDGQIAAELKMLALGKGGAAEFLQ